MLESNDLKLHKIKSSSIPTPLNNINDIQTCIKNIQEYIKTDSLVIAYLDYTVLVGRYSNNTFKFCDNHSLDTKYIQRIRIFNIYEEIMLWRSNNWFKGRYRRDREGDEVNVVDAKQVLYGTDKEDLGNGFTRIFEKRGTEIILPFTGLDVRDKTKDKRVFIQTRNYVDPEALQATYFDCRFMGFYNDGKPLS